MRIMKPDINTRELFRAILLLKTPGECAQFFRDLLTEDEIREFSERWHVVRLLNKKLSYREIQKLTGLSLATIVRVAKWFKQGEGGYQLIVKRLNKAEEDIQDPITDTAKDDQPPL